MSDYWEDADGFYADLAELVPLGFLGEDVDPPNDAFAVKPAPDALPDDTTDPTGELDFTQHYLPQSSPWELDRAAPSLPAVTGDLDNHHGVEDSVIGTPFPCVKDQANEDVRLDTPCTSEAPGATAARRPAPPPPTKRPPPPPTAAATPTWPSPAIATNSANKCDEPGGTPPILTWRFVNKAKVKEFVAALPRATTGDAAFLECSRWLVEEFGSLSGSSNPRDGPVYKVLLINRALVKMSRTLCFDLRADARRFIIEPDLLPDEVLSGRVQRMLRPGRRYTVHDPLAKNCILRELQRTWCPGARGTKGLTEMLDACGEGPLETARAWEVKA